MSTCTPDCQCGSCTGSSCAACLELDPALPISTNCPHDAVEQQYGMRALSLIPDSSRANTKEMPPLVLGCTIIVEVADDMIEALAQYHDAVARILRARGRVKLTAE